MPRGNLMFLKQMLKMLVWRRSNFQGCGQKHSYYCFLLFTTKFASVQILAFRLFNLLLQIWVFRPAKSYKNQQIKRKRKEGKRMERKIDKKTPKISRTVSCCEIFCRLIGWILSNRLFFSGRVLQLYFLRVFPCGGPSTIASRVQFKPIKNGEKLVLN